MIKRKVPEMAGAWGSGTQAMVEKERYFIVAEKEGMYVEMRLVDLKA